MILVDLEGFREELGSDSMILIAGQTFQCEYRGKRDPRGRKTVSAHLISRWRLGWL